MKYHSVKGSREREKEKSKRVRKGASQHNSLVVPSVYNTRKSYVKEMGK